MDDESKIEILTLKPQINAPTEKESPAQHAHLRDHAKNNNWQSNFTSTKLLHEMMNTRDTTNRSFSLNAKY